MIDSLALSAERERHTENVFHMFLTPEPRSFPEKSFESNVMKYKKKVYPLCPSNTRVLCVLCKEAK